MAGEGIRSGKEAAWNMDDFEIKVCKVKQPPCLSTVEILCLMEVRQVLVVGKDLDGERGSVEVVPPRLQGTDNGKEFSVVDVVVMLCWDERLGEVGAGVPIAIRVGLKEDGTRGIFQGISGNHKRFGEVWEVEDGS